MMTEQLAQPQSMHRRAQRAPIRTLFGRGMEARKPLSGHTGVLLVTRRNGLFRRAATGAYVIQIKASAGHRNPAVKQACCRHTTPQRLQLPGGAAPRTPED